MNKLSFVLFFLLILFVESQNLSLDSKFIDGRVLSIKSNLINCKVIEKSKTERGSKLIYLQNDAVQLITVSDKANWHTKEVAWYFENGQLLFSEQKTTDINSKAITNNEKFYFQEGHLKAWINMDNHLVDDTSEAFRYMDTEIIEFASSLKADALK